MKITESRTAGFEAEIQVHGDDDDDQINVVDRRDVTFRRRFLLYLVIIHLCTVPIEQHSLRLEYSTL